MSNENFYISLLDQTGMTAENSIIYLAHIIIV